MTSSGICRLKKVILAVLATNPGRPFSTSAIQKAIYDKLVELKELRTYLGAELSRLTEIVTLNIHGPTLECVTTALTELVAEGSVSVEEIQTYRNGRTGHGCLYSLMTKVDPTELDLPFEISRLGLSPFEKNQQLVTRAKEDSLNRFTGKDYKWRDRRNARFAYSMFREISLVNSFVSKPQAMEILDLMYTFDQAFQFAQHKAKRRGEEFLLPDIGGLAEILLEVLECESLSGNEKGVAEIIDNWVKGFASENRLQDRLKSDIDEDGNLLIALVGQNPEKIMLLFHLDTVKDCFPPKIADGNVYGRGAVDNKSQGLIAIYTIMLLAVNHIIPQFSIVVLGATCEEISDPSKRGILKAIRRYGLSRENTSLVVVLEATNLKVATGQRQRWTGEIELYGPGIHAAHTYQNEEEWIRNRHCEKIDTFTRFPDLRALVSRASCEIRAIPVSSHNGDGRKRRTTITLRESYEDTTSNQTPSSGKIGFDIRLAEQNEKDEIDRKLNDILKHWLPSPFGYAWDHSKDNCSGVADFLASNVGNETKDLLEKLKPFFDLFDATPTTYEFGVDGRYTVEAGIPTIGLGPGEEHNAHRSFNHLKPEEAREMLERIRISDLFKAIVVYTVLIQLCTYHKSYDGRAEIRTEICLRKSEDSPTPAYIS